MENFLHRIGAMARDTDGKLRPTAAGLLMFGHEYEIVREFPHYFLDYQEHDRSATEDERWTDRIVSSSGDWSGNICDFYFRVYNRIAQDIKVPFKLNGADRIDDTPLHKALREALANALIHADYYDRRGLVIQKWPDKIRIANPGAFRINVQEALVGGVSDPRNESLIKMFNLINVGERAGSGLPSIRSVWQKQAWQVPEIVEGQTQPWISHELSPWGQLHKPSGTSFHDGFKVRSHSTSLPHASQPWHFCLANSSTRGKSPANSTILSRVTSGFLLCCSTGLIMN